MTGSTEADTPDDVLVAAARKGDTRAFESLLGRHETRVLRVLRLMGVPGQDREDVAQEVFVRVFRHLDGFQRGRPFQSWVYKIAVNAAHDYRAARGRRVPEERLGLAERGTGPETTAEVLDLRARLLAALGRLSDRERSVFVLKELEGLETREVARTLGITRVTVRRHLGLARKRLQAGLAGPEPTSNPEKPASR